jgi:hypothetical protein
MRSHKGDEVTYAQDYLITSEVHIMADVPKHGIAVTKTQIHALGLVVVGGWYEKGGPQFTVWDFPGGEPGEPMHRACRSTCGRKDDPGDEADFHF